MSNEKTYYLREDKTEKPHNNKKTLGTSSDKRNPFIMLGLYLMGHSKKLYQQKLYQELMQKLPCLVILFYLANQLFDHARRVLNEPFLRFYGDKAKPRILLTSKNELPK